MARKRFCCLSGLCGLVLRILLGGVVLAHYGGYGAVTVVCDSTRNAVVTPIIAAEFISEREHSAVYEMGCRLGIAHRCLDGQCFRLHFLIFLIRLGLNGRT